jgi:hypothetical protein
MVVESHGNMVANDLEIRTSKRWNAVEQDATSLNGIPGEPILKTLF